MAEEHNKTKKRQNVSLLIRETLKYQPKLPVRTDTSPVQYLPHPDWTPSHHTQRIKRPLADIWNYSDLTLALIRTEQLFYCVICHNFVNTGGDPHLTLLVPQLLHPVPHCFSINKPPNIRLLHREHNKGFVLERLEAASCSGLEKASIVIYW